MGRKGGQQLFEIIVLTFRVANWGATVRKTCADIPVGMRTTRLFKKVVLTFWFRNAGHGNCSKKLC